jgi:hypothetical protein
VVSRVEQGRRLGCAFEKAVRRKQLARRTRALCKLNGAKKSCCSWRESARKRRSLIHTCELCGANPFDLTQLQRHVVELARNPSQWMPWNYHARLERSGVSVDSG